MSVTDELLQANEADASTFKESDLRMPPAQGVAKGKLDEVT